MDLEVVEVQKTLPELCLLIIFLRAEREREQTHRLPGGAGAGVEIPESGEQVLDHPVELFVFLTVAGLEILLRNGRIFPGRTLGGEVEGDEGFHGPEGASCILYAREEEVFLSHG